MKNGRVGLKWEQGGRGGGDRRTKSCKKSVFSVPIGSILAFCVGTKVSLAENGTDTSIKPNPTQRKRNTFKLGLVSEFKLDFELDVEAEATLKQGFKRNVSIRFIVYGFRWYLLVSVKASHE